VKTEKTEGNFFEISEKNRKATFCNHDNIFVNICFLRDERNV